MHHVKKHFYAVIKLYIPAEPINITIYTQSTKCF